MGRKQAGTSKGRTYLPSLRTNLQASGPRRAVLSDQINSAGSPHDTRTRTTKPMLVKSIAKKATAKKATATKGPAKKAPAKVAAKKVPGKKR